MKNSILWGALLILALVLSACGPTGTATETSMTLEPTEPPIESTEPPADVTEIPTTSTEGIPVTGGEVTVGLAEIEGHGSILVDGEGNALYIFTNDQKGAETSACTGDCVVNWPPLTISTGSPIPGEGVDDSLLGTITLPDGSIQVTYNGWPLYRYAQDVNPGDTLGQGFGGVWYLISATGDVIM